MAGEFDPDYRGEHLKIQFTVVFAGGFLSSFGEPWSGFALRKPPAAGIQVGRFHVGVQQ
jgi:hypothetical protein